MHANISNQSARLVWVTPDPEKTIAYCARVSSDNPDKEEYVRLLNYLINHKHWSPFEMASMCLEIRTTRDISRQLLRHRSFSFQEFSQRYSDDIEFAGYLRETRTQDDKNRQNSIATKDVEKIFSFFNAQTDTMDFALTLYKKLRALGIAKEQARCVLPEGLTMSRLFVSGTMRSWIHYCEVRCDPSTQKEHRELAGLVLGILQQQLPSIKLNV